MNEGTILAIVGGVVCGLSGALFGVACGRRGQPGPAPSWVGLAFLAAAVLGVVGAVAGVAALIVGQQGVPFAVIGGGAALAVLSVVFYLRPRSS